MIELYNSLQLYEFSAKDKSGKLHRVKTDQQYLFLTPFQRQLMYEKCPPVLSVISGRANWASGLPFAVTSVHEHVDEIESGLNDMRQIHSEFQDNDPRSIGIRIRVFYNLKKYLIDIKPDLSNFNGALRRWKNNVKFESKKSKAEVEDWLAMPAPGITRGEFIKMAVQDLLIHGSLAINWSTVFDKIHNINVMQGGSVIPVKTNTSIGAIGYVQVIEGEKDPLFFYPDELAYIQYMPSSSKLTGVIPMNALVSLVTENLLFSELMAKKADQDEPPEKLLAFSDGEDEDIDDLPDTMSPDEQSRVEEKINQRNKKKAIATITGYGTPTVIDLTRSETLAVLSERQNKIDKYVAMSFNASNIEVNQTGSDGTNGRSTSEAQLEGDRVKAVGPTLNSIESLFNEYIFPRKFGSNFWVEFSYPKSEKDTIDNVIKLKNAGLIATNEGRVKLDMLEKIDSKYDELGEAASNGLAGLFGGSNGG